MLVERVTDPDSQAQTYLVAGHTDGPGFIIDAGGPAEDLIERAQELGVSPEVILLTHHHEDQVRALGALCERWPEMRALAEPQERELMAEKELLSGEAQAGRKLRVGDLEIVPLRTPGHSLGLLSYLVGRPGGPRSSAIPIPGGFNGRDGVVFTGDTLLRGSVGGIKESGGASYTELRDSIMGTLMELPPHTVIYPGHADPTTVAEEWELNPFIRVWRGLDCEGEERCMALGREARLILMGLDYDGASKAWVRWEEGFEDILPGAEIRMLSSAARLAP